MRQLLNKARKISIFILTISLIGCTSDDTDKLPKIIPGFTFTINDDTGTVTFINISENSRTYAWTYGDGDTSTEINPIKTYEPGTYTVILKASNVAGASGTFEDTITIVDRTTTTPGDLALPITFDDSDVDYAGSIDGSFSVVDNPAPGGANDVASKVGAIENAGEQWEATVANLDTPVDFSTNKTITIKLWSESILPILLKFEGGVNGERENEVVVNHGGTGWEELSFDFATNATKSFIDGNQGVGEAFVPTGQYATMVVFVDGPGTTAGTFYMDDIVQKASVGGSDECIVETAESLSAVNFNLTFQTDPTASIGSFDALLTWVDNPDVDSQNNESCKVGQIDRDGSALFANNQIALDAKLNFSDNAGFKMKVWSPAAGTNVLVKLEDQANAGTFTELSVATTKSSEWEELTFPFANTENGRYDLIILFFQLNTNTTETYFIDDFALYPREGGNTGGNEDNLVTNGDFETGDASGWDTAPAGNSGTFAVSTEMPACGDYSANLRAESAGLHLITQSGIGTGIVTPNSEVTVSFDLRGTLEGAGGTFFAILLSESSTNGVSKTDILGGAPIFATEPWTRYSFTTTTGPDVSAGLILQLKVECGADAGCVSDAFVDNVFIALGPDSGPACDSTGGSGGTPSLTATPVTVNEAAGNAVFSITLTGADVAGGFTVDYATSDGSAVQPDDYTSTSGTLTFVGTSGESQDIVVPIVDDSLDENQENFILTLSNISDMGVMLGGPVDGNINDNDGTTSDLADNGGFESGDFDGWALYTNNGSITLDNTDPSSGTWSATIVATPTGQNPTLKQERKGAGTLSVGDTVEITFDYKGSLSGVGGVYSIQSFVEATNGVNQVEDFSVTPTNAWQTFTATYTVNAGDIAGGITMEFVAICGADPGTNCVSTLSVDNVSMVINP